MEQKTYQNRYENCSQTLTEIQSICNRISFWRGICFVLGAALFFIGYNLKNTICMIAAAAAFILFLFFVQRHQKQKEKQIHLENLSCVLKDYLARFNNDWKEFSLHGEQYLSDELLELKDLDIFGKNSLYQYICTASTIYGQDQLAFWLNQSVHMSQTVNSPAVILNRQEAVAELTEKPDFTLEFEATARELRSIDYDTSKGIMNDFFHALRHKSQSSQLRRTAVRLFPILTLACLLFAVLDINRPFMAFCFASLALLQLMAAFFCRFWNDRILAPIYRLNHTITPYKKLLQDLEQESFDSFYLCSMQEDLLKNKTASAALKELEAITDAVKIRHNLYAFLLYNSLFLYDFYCVERYAKWQETYRNEIKDWMLAIGKMEALISLGVLSHTKEVHTMPKISNSDHPFLSVKDLKHPLLNESLAVGNDMDLKHSVCIITGSNMSGKTTFMRSIGVNLFLAYAGGYCTAQDFSVSIMELCTSIRTEDSVQEGISTFYAELLRIRNMIHTSRKHLPMIALIDEIYKGTNSKDRIFAAKETIKKLSSTYAFLILTTHDFELCDLESDAALDAENYHFTENYENHEILFDYKIREGRCATTNARYLLQIAGILE